jgi:hypothetical protein
VNYLFVNWDFRKLYAQAPEFNVPQFGSGKDRLLVEEGRLCEHVFFDGRYWDDVIFAVYRSEWERRSKPWLDAITGGRGQADGKP